MFLVCRANFNYLWNISSERNATCEVKDNAQPSDGKKIHEKQSRHFEKKNTLAHWANENCDRSPTGHPCDVLIPGWTRGANKVLKHPATDTITLATFILCSPAKKLLPLFFLRTILPLMHPHPARRTKGRTRTRTRMIMSMRIPRFMELCVLQGFKSQGKCRVVLIMAKQSSDRGPTIVSGFTTTLVVKPKMCLAGPPHSVWRHYLGTPVFTRWAREPKFFFLFGIAYFRSFFLCDFFFHLLSSKRRFGIW